MVKHSACMKLLSDLIDNESLIVTNLTTNARMWSALRGDRPSFYGLNMGLCLPFAVGLALAFPKRKVIALDGDGSLIIETSSSITAVSQPVGLPRRLHLSLGQQCDCSPPPHLNQRLAPPLPRR